jgi:hypothetical protein
VGYAEPYGSAPHTDWVDAALGVVGIQMREGLGESPGARTRRGLANLKAPANKPLVLLAREHNAALREGRLPINPRYLDFLAGQNNPATLAKWGEAAMKKLEAVKTTDFFTGADKEEAVKQQVEWVRAISDRYREISRQGKPSLVLP